jgi:ribosomal protein S12 methylthiotransferase accessory factor
MIMDITFPGGARVDASFKGFTVQTDQPVYAGGEGSAPPPFQLFLASIGTCAGIFVLNFCRQRDIPTDGIRMQQSVETDPETRKVSRIAIDIALPADFPERYVGAVKRAADLCSVKKLIEKPPEFAVEARIEAK